MLPPVLWELEKIFFNLADVNLGKRAAWKRTMLHFNAMCGVWYVHKEYYFIFLNSMKLGEQDVVGFMGSDWRNLPA